MKSFSALRKVAVAAIALTLGVFSQTDSQAQTINIGPNQYAFRYTVDNDYGLFFNSTSQRYEFRNGSANSIFGFDANTGAMSTNISFASGSDLLIGPNRYAFRSSVAPGVGLYATNNRIQFLNASANPVFSINIADGMFDSDIEFLAGKNLKVAAGNYAIRSATSPNAGLYFGAVDYELRNTAGNPVFRVSSANGNTVANGSISASGGNSSQWNSAFGWGNHATQGYISSETDPQVGALSSNAIPSWNGSQLVNSALDVNAAGLNMNFTAAVPVISFNSSSATANPLFSFRRNGSQISFIQAFNDDFFISNGVTSGDMVFRTQNATRMTIDAGGNIGVGAAPSVDSKLHVERSTSGFTGGVIEATVTYVGESDVRAILATSTPAGGYGYGVQATGGYRGVYGVGAGGAYTGSVYGVQGATSGTGVGTRIGIYGSASGGATNWAGYFAGNTYVSGDLRLGTTNGATGYKLAVNGKIICTEARVQAVTNWPDYVFGDNYELMDLNELESFLKEKKHLPGIPSAAEMEAEQGFDMGEMHKMTLEKVEELTLYIIDQNKKMSAQQKEIDELKALVGKMIKN